MNLTAMDLKRKLTDEEDWFNIVFVDDTENVLYVRCASTENIFLYNIEFAEFTYYCKDTDWSHYAPAGAKKRRRRK